GQARLALPGTRRDAHGRLGRGEIGDRDASRGRARTPARVGGDDHVGVAPAVREVPVVDDGDAGARHARRRRRVEGDGRDLHVAGDPTVDLHRGLRLSTPGIVHAEDARQREVAQGGRVDTPYGVGPGELDGRLADDDGEVADGPRDA